MGRNTQLMRGKVSALAKPAEKPATPPAKTGGSAGADPLPHNMMRENSEKPKGPQPAARIKRLPARLTPRTCARILTGKPAAINDSTIVVDRDGSGKQDQ